MPLHDVVAELLSLELRKALKEYLLERVFVAAASAAMASAPAVGPGKLLSDIEEVKQIAGMALGKTGKASLRDIDQGLRRRGQPALAKEVSNNNAGRCAVAHPSFDLQTRVAKVLVEPLEHNQDNEKNLLSRPPGLAEHTVVIEKGLPMDVKEKRGESPPVPPSLGSDEILCAKNMDKGSPKHPKQYLQAPSPASAALTEASEMGDKALPKNFKQKGVPKAKERLPLAPKVTHSEPDLTKLLPTLRTLHADLSTNLKNGRGYSFLTTPERGVVKEFMEKLSLIALSYERNEAPGEAIAALTKLSPTLRTLQANLATNLESITPGGKHKQHFEQTQGDLSLLHSIVFTNENQK